jgi:hypothetical protein
MEGKMAAKSLKKGKSLKSVKPLKGGKKGN